jgi:hypothetical protein
LTCKDVLSITQEYLLLCSDMRTVKLYKYENVSCADGILKRFPVTEGRDTCEDFNNKSMFCSSIQGPLLNVWSL